MAPKELKLQPLNSNNNMTGADLYAKLKAEANALRKEKKRNTYSGIHKYLHLLEGQPKFPCILDASSRVISFPPITNSEVSKVTNQNFALQMRTNFFVVDYSCYQRYSRGSY